MKESLQTIQKSVESIEQQFEATLHPLDSEKDLEDLRIRFLGRKGDIAVLFKQIADLSVAEKPAAGQLVNALKEKLHHAVEAKSIQIRSNKSKTSSATDSTLPGNTFPLGGYHPLTLVLREIKTCFAHMGFSVADGPEVELEYYNFEALNIPQGHPARAMHDSFFIDENVVLRTHTSPVQVRVMEKQSPPIRIIAPGRCYRRDTPDATHSPVFHQVEGLCVDVGVTFADLKGIISHFARSIFGPEMKIRFRPSFFPFTEPSAEYDFSCLFCSGRGCSVCKGSGWVEISGAGMVNPKVFEWVGYDKEKYTGYAFGMGVERIAMLKYGVHDIRLFYENDVRFLHQF